MRNLNLQLLCCWLVFWAPPSRGFESLNNQRRSRTLTFLHVGDENLQLHLTVFWYRTQSLEPRLSLNTDISRTLSHSVQTEGQRLQVQVFLRTNSRSVIWIRFRHRRSFEDPALRTDLCRLSGSFQLWRNGQKIIGDIS